MKIAWLAYNVSRRGDELVSTAASVRYRLIIPARALSALGHEVKILRVGAETGVEDLVDGSTGEVLVIPKYMNPDAAAFERMAGVTLGVMRAAQKKGQRVVAEISDDHFDHPTYGPYFRDLVRQCDQVVASTPGLAGIIRSHTQRAIHVVGDPYEGIRHEPRLRPPESPARKASRSLLSILKTAPAGGHARPVRLLWFGHGSNFSALLAMLPQLQRLLPRHAVEVHAVTAADTNAAQVSENFNRDYAPGCTLRFTPWSAEATWRALEECDLVVIPSKLDDRAKAVKSSNRIIESIWAGRFVCANPVPSYQEFSRYAWIAEDLAAGIEWAITHAGEVLERLRAGQEHVARHYSPEAIARQWESALAGSPAALPQGNSSLRINLGCGDKIMAGYVNVDVAESRNRKQPDVLCDLHRLHVFADDTADEILSVHVIEHFWRWEVLDVLKEWVRVLRPGGRMVLECPNLAEACRNFLADPDGASGPGIESQRTMWVFYGDPKWVDPLQVHRWGYTPYSLGQLMTEAGLVNVRQEPAQFAQREPRDMRVVGEKPA